MKNTNLSWVTRKRVLACALGLQAVCLGSVQALTINLNDIGGVTGTDAEVGFQTAAAIWESYFTDNVTVNLDVGYASLGAGILGSTGSTSNFYSYTNVRNALVADATSADDATATANLVAGANVDRIMNFTGSNPNGAGSSATWLDNDDDANNQTVRMTQANARALGLYGANAAGTDASITFSTNFSWDFDTSNGVGAGLFDFVGVAVHEIGHALGFTSGVDVLDINAPGAQFDEAQFQFYTTLDLYRYSDLSVAAGANDGAADTRDKWFSIDGGTTNLAYFSEGRINGDGRQASHWRDNLGIGIMDPTFASGEIGAVSALDVMAFDVIGWDLNTGTPPVPEPATLTLMGIGLVGLAYRRRKA